jgi:uncharacterized protein YdhG (YjbR/CyaY superfamily)
MAGLSRPVIDEWISNYCSFTALYLNPENKKIRIVQYEVKTPSEYIEKLENDWRKEKLQQVREMIKKHGPDLIEGIEYKMLSFGTNEKSIFHLNAQRAYVSLYVGTINKVDHAQELLKKFDTGKGCVRIKKKVDVQDSELEEFIRKTIELWERGGNTDC